MDITDALAPTSDQLDAIELVNPRTFTIDTGSALGKRDGKTVAEIRLADFPRVWRPSKGMLDVLAACWGTDGTQYVGRRVTLYNDPDVMFGRDKVGGIRIKALSHIDGARTLSIRAPGQGGRKQQWHVEPLTEPAPTRPARPATQPAADKPSHEQTQAIADGFRAALIVDGDDRARFVAEVLGREMSGWGDLTAADAQLVIDALGDVTA